MENELIVLPFAHIDDEGDMALMGKLNRIIGEIGQNLPQPQGVALEYRGHIRRDLPP